MNSQENQNWLNDYFKQLVPLSNGVYLGFPITFTNIPYTNMIYYGKTSYKKLIEIKKKYDPENILTYSGTLL